MCAQSIVYGYWVKLIIRNNLETNEIALNHNRNMEKKLYVKNSSGLKEYPYWKHRENSFIGESRIGAQYRILMPRNEDTIIYNFFRSSPFDMFYSMTNGVDRMTVGLWKDIRLRLLVRFSSNNAVLAISISFGLYYFHLSSFKR